MSEILQSDALRAARNQASIDLADEALSGKSSIKFYDARGGDLLGVKTLKDPCGTLNGQQRIELQASDDVDVILDSGSIQWAEWCDKSGSMLIGCTVTDESGSGPIKMVGTGGTSVQAGGVILLVTPVLIG